MSDGPATCPKCGREFKSKKALGPHARHCGKSKPAKAARKMTAPARTAKVDDVPIEIARGLVNDALDLLAATRKAGITITAQK